MTALILVLVVGLGAAPSVADGFRPITSKSEFLTAVGNRSLMLPLYGANVQVSPNGQIRGKVAGRPLSGNWQWNGGYFCRDLYWGARDLGNNCQEVRIRGDKIRFTENRGAGRSADFRLQ